MTTELQRHFNQLRDQWLVETRFLSSSTAIAANANYQAIIFLGSRVVPLILEDLAKTHCHWFEALSAITGDHPVPKKYWGNISIMTYCWLVWGVEHGYNVKLARIRLGLRLVFKAISRTMKAQIC